jgi:hypothetical protein
MLNGPRGLLARASQANGGLPPSLLFDGDPTLQPGLIQVDWPGFPVRVKQAIDQADVKLDKFIDWTRGGLTVGRSYCHEEYLEWRSVRQVDGKLVRLEFTTETPDYWQKLARFEPQKLVELAGRFAGESPDRVDVAELFGMADPFSADPLTAAGEAVERAYRRQNFAGADSNGVPRPARGAYNNGAKAILHMANGVNSTNAALALAVFAAFPHGKRVGTRQVALSGPEAIEGTRQAAVNCRNSDPTIVGAVVGAVFAGAKVALMDPFGIYILSIDQSGLVLADGSPVPDSWFSLQRGTSAGNNPVGRDLFQRLVIQAPPGSGLTLSDIRDPEDKPVETGAQLARLINVGLLARRTAAGAVTVARNIVATPSPPACDGSAPDSQVFIAGWEAYSNAGPATPGPLLRTGG